jgi:hypothetical protein
VFGAVPSADPSPDQRVAYYEGLLPVVEDYLRALTALDAPSDVEPVVNRLVADAYATWLTVVDVLMAHQDGDEASVSSAAARLDAQLNQADSSDDDLRALGFEVCAA